MGGEKSGRGFVGRARRSSERTFKEMEIRTDTGRRKKKKRKRKKRKSSKNVKLTKGRKRRGKGLTGYPDNHTGWAQSFPL
jgi:hypothetical protein